MMISRNAQQIRRSADLMIFFFEENNSHHLTEKLTTHMKAINKLVLSSKGIEQNGSFLSSEKITKKLEFFNPSWDWDIWPVRDIFYDRFRISLTNRFSHSKKWPFLSRCKQLQIQFFKSLSPQTYRLQNIRNLIWLNKWLQSPMSHRKIKNNIDFTGITIENEWKFRERK